MTNWTEFGGDEKFFVPEFDLLIDGELLTGDVKADVLNVAYQDSVDTLDSFEILVNNWDADKLEFKYSDTHQFDPGRELELRMGYVGEIGLRLMIRGEITSIRPTFPTRRFSRMVVSGVNVLHRFRDQQRSLSYAEMKDSEIAEEIGGRLGVTVRTDGAAKAAEPIIFFQLQDNQYDLVFLMERARRNGYDLFVEDDGETVYFGPTKNVGDPLNIVRYGSFALEFEPHVSLADQVTEVTVRAWSFEDKELIERTVSRAGGLEARPGEAGIKIDPRQEIVVTQPMESGEEADALVAGTFERIRQKFVTAAGSLVGIPDVRAGTVLRVEGLDRRFSGDYFVTASRHVFDDSGYSTRFECRMEGL